MELRARRRDSDKEGMSLGSTTHKESGYDAANRGNENWPEPKCKINTLHSSETCSETWTTDNRLETLDIGGQHLSGKKSED